ncbi:MAG: PAS domain S-box protein [Magnetospirillum sp.]|nr:PAS domain S-box protein [Magnetospirillum sp.]
MALAVLLLGVLLWLLHRNELEEARLALIKDILWVEQNIHFHLDSGEEKLTQLVAELARGDQPVETFEVQARGLIATSGDFDRILLRDAEGGLAAAVPPSVGDRSGEVVGEAAPWWSAFTLAKSIGRAAWSAPFAIPGRGQVFEVHVPIFRDHRFVGMLVGEVAVDSLLAQQVPWWVAEKYKVEIIDANGTTLGAKTNVQLAEPGPSHQVRLEPPGQGVAVVATVYATETNLARNLLAAAIFALAILAVSSLWTMRRHARRRFAAEQALRTEHAFRKAMEDLLTVGMRARDLTGRITYVNPAFCRMVGWSEEELVGCMPPMPYWSPDAMDSTMEWHKRVMAGDAPPDGFEIQFRRRNGETFWALIYEAPLIDANGRQSGWMASVLDVTERKSAEELERWQQEKLQRTGRLITMGEMASTLAHELNQPLSAIASYNTGCLNRLALPEFDPADLRTALTKLGVQAQRAGQIIRRVHDFVRKSEPQLKPCTLNGVVEDTVGFMEFDAKSRGVQLKVSLSPANPAVTADRILLEQVVLNLARNGAEAMAHTPARQRKLSIGVTCQDGQAVVSVADHGPGIAPDVAANLFQPFFTTKEEGMGMGLNICRSIIEYHQGRLWFEPNEGGGAVFRFSLPTRSP